MEYLVTEIRAPFPDLKGQAPLRRGPPGRLRPTRSALFLTSKVRLHCDLWDPSGIRTGLEPFPDLKGQAPLRRNIITNTAVEDRTLFLTSKVRLHCDHPNSPLAISNPVAFS